MQEDLHTYLNDHLSGSVVALDLLGYCSQNPPSGITATEILRLRDEIASDQQLLRELLQTLGGKETLLKQAGAWLTEKMTHMKLRLSPLSGSDLGAVEAFEIISLGIEGKAGLWKALAKVAHCYEVLQYDWAQLTARAAEQRELVESWRIQAAVRSFTPIEKQV